MTIKRCLSVTATALALAVVTGPVSAAELVYGSWTPAREYQNRVVMPDLFKNIEKDTNGQIQWKLIAGGQIADGKTTFTGGQGRPDAGRARRSRPMCRTRCLRCSRIYSTVILGHNDVVAATGAAMETFYLNCPSCLEEMKKLNSVALGGWTSSAYLLACREPVKSLADLKGKRVRATGGNAEMFKMAGAVPVGATLVEAVSLLQRGGLDCQHGIADWMRTFGYADFAKHVTDIPLGLTGPAIGFFMNRDTWNKFTPEQKKVHSNMPRG